MTSTQRLSELCERIVDCPHSTPVWTTEGVVVLRSHNIRNGRLDLSDLSYTDEPHYIERTRRATPQAGDLVITREAPMGEVCMVPPGLRCCLGQRMVLLRPQPTRVNGRYLLYALQSPKVQHEIGVNEGTGSTVSNLRIPVLESLPIPTPHLGVQERIADILGSLDDKIEVNRRTNETLEAMARTLFRSWFGDFDPVRAKADGRHPSGLDAATAALFPDAFEDSRIGPIPKGWRVVDLPDAIEVNPSRSLRKDTVAPYLDMGNMPTASARALDWEMRECGSGAKFVNGDVLLARITPCLENGKTAFVDFMSDGEVGWGSTEYIVLRSKPPLPVGYAYFLARSDELRTHAIRNMTGTSGRQRVPADCFKSFPVVVPPEPIARRFGELAHSTMQSMKGNDEQSRTLAAMRDTLLPKLLSGELKVAHESAE